MTWLRNCWYQAGWADEVAVDKPLTRTILGEPILFWLGGDAQVAAVADRCPHRFAPLSAGRVQGDVVTCGYHGLGFSRDGTCVANPHAPITASMRVKSYPTAVRHSAIWIWMGDPSAASMDDLPDLSFIDETPEQARIQMYMPTRANYQLIADNILDLSHADYLHPNSLGGIMTGAKATSREVDGKIIVEWKSNDCVPPPAFKPLVPPGSNADMWTEVVWQAPALMVLSTAATPPRVERAWKDESRTLHNMVPETETTTHYFACSTRRFHVEDEHFSAMLRGALEDAFVREDKPMLELQQQSMGSADLWSLGPMLLPIDAGAVRARRKLDVLIEAEQRTCGAVDLQRIAPARDRDNIS